MTKLFSALELTLMLKMFGVRLKCGLKNIKSQCELCQTLNVSPNLL
jgi:hypothetical protein